MSWVTPADFESFRDPADPLDDAPVLNAMFDSAANDPGMRLDWYGSWSTKSTVHVRGDYSLQIVGEVVAAAPMDTVVHVDARHGRFQGILRAYGQGSSVYSQRTATHGITLGYCLRSRFDGFEPANAKRHGLGIRTQTGDNAIGVHLGSVVSRDCGSAGSLAGNHTSKSRAWFAGRSDVGSGSLVTQYSELTIDPADTASLAAIGDLLTGDVVLHEGAPYLVTYLDVPGGKLRVFPQLQDTAISDGVLELCHGAALRIAGGNTSGITADSVHSTRCGVATVYGGLYGGSIGSIVSEATGVGVQLATTTGGSAFGGHLGHLHLEGTAVHLLKVNRTATPLHIASMSVWEPSAHVGLTTRTGNRKYAQLEGVTLHHIATHQTTRVQLPDNTAVPTPQVGNAPHRSSGTLRRDNPTLQIVWDQDANTRSAVDTFQLYLTGLDGGAPGVVTLTTPSGDSSTIAGAAPPYTLTTYTPILLTGIRDVTGSNWTIYTTQLRAAASGGFVSFSSASTYTFGDGPDAGTSTELGTVTVSGTDVVIASVLNITGPGPVTLDLAELDTAATELSGLIVASPGRGRSVDVEDNPDADGEAEKLTYSEPDTVDTEGRVTLGSGTKTLTMKVATFEGLRSALAAILA